MSSPIVRVVIALTSIALGVAAARRPTDPPARTQLHDRVVRVPLTKEGPFYFVAGTINGKPVRLTIETGAGFFAISNSAAQRLGLKTESAADEPVAAVPALTIGGATFSGLTARVTPLFERLGFDGILSIPVLHDVLATLDFPARELRFEHGALPEPNGRDILPIAGRDRGGRIDVPIRAGGVEIPAVLDTRSFLWVILPDELEPKLPLAGAPRDAGTAAGPSLGTFRMRGARLRGDLTIGANAVKNPAVILRDRPGATLGAPLLEHYAITIDQLHNRVRFIGSAVTMPPLDWEVQAPPPPAAPGQPTMGFNLMGTPGRLIVRNIVPGSDAEKQGLQEGDELIELNGTPVAEMRPEVFRAAAAAGAPVKVVVKRAGKTIELHIRP